MPRFHIHSADGHRHIDPEGIELADEHTARLQAMSFAGEMLRHDPVSVWQHGHWRVEVTDDCKKLLFTIITLAIDAPRDDELTEASPAGG